MRCFLPKLIMGLVFSFPFALFAKNTKAMPVSAEEDYQKEQALIETQLLNKKGAFSFSINEDSGDKSPEAMEASLLADPQLLQSTMESVLMQRDIKQIKIVLPIYQKSVYADPILIHYARALIHHSEGDYKKAIDAYREILAKEPDLFAIRYSLATAFYQNNQFSNALQQFEKLQPVDDMPNQMRESVTNAINAIKKQEEWQFYANFYFKKEDNINNAPTQRTIKFGSGQLTFEPPEKATGVHLDFSASKRNNLATDWYTNIKFNINSDYFWDNKSYNDLNLRAGIALGYQNTQLTAELEPFVRKRFFGNSSYSSTAGIQSYIKYQFNSKFSLSNTTAFSYEKFSSRHHLNGQRQFTGLTAVYQPNAKQYWFTGVNYFNSEAKYLDDSFLSRGIYVGWGQAWHKGISSKLFLSANQKDYKGADIFNIKRRDKSYTAELSLWHRSVQFYGLTPKLVLSWDKTDSNHFYYDNREEVKATIELSTYF